MKNSTWFMLFLFVSINSKVQKDLYGEHTRTNLHETVENPAQQNKLFEEPQGSE